jgi:methylglutaconyl-CoA hydratase
MIKYSFENQIGILSLNRPEKRNALHPELVKEMRAKLAELENEKDLKVIIITGEGKSFCAGADLEYLNSLRNYSVIDNENDSASLAELFLQIYKFSKPTIAAVDGAAIAGGCGLASVCDFIIADKSHAKFGYSEVKIGFIPAIVSIFLIKKIGEGRSEELMLTGEIIDAEKALNIGLVNKISDDALYEAKSFALEICKNSSLSMSLTKNMIHSISGFNVEEAVDYCIRLNTISRGTEDFQQGLNNFLDKK